jgi:valyl-tRNA synthetase
MHQNNPYCQEKIYQQLYNFQTKIITIQALPTSPNSTRKKRRKLKITRVEVIKIYAKKNKKKKRSNTIVYAKKKKKRKKKERRLLLSSYTYTTEYLPG